MRSEWSWESWKGFYRYLEDELDTGTGDWSLRSKSGWRISGFLVDQIHPNGNGESEITCNWKPTSQTIVICFASRSTFPRKFPRNGGRIEVEMHERILEAGGGKVMEPLRMRVGWTMTVGLWNGEWLAFSNGAIDCPGTVANLRVAEEILRSAAETCN